MAHQMTEAASSPMTMADKAASFEEALFESGDPFEEEEQPGDEPGDDIDDDFADDGEEGDNGDDESDEQAKPAIDAPVSLNAEEKEVFAQLPVEAQQAWAASETRRNQQVQEATTRASEAQRTAEQRAAAADVQAQTLYRAQLEQVVTAFAPQEPNPNDYGDIRQYQADKARYDYAKAQHDQFAQQVAAIGVETPEMKAQRYQARDAQLMAIPEVANPETRDEYISSAMKLASEFGYEQAELADIMEARDLKILAQAARWKADSEELARIRARSSERRRDVKSGQFRTMKPGAAVPGGTGNTASKSFERVKATRGNRQAQSEAFGDFLEKGGYL
jgi:hypothetical protein